MTDRHDDGYRSTNREKARAPRFGHFWCWGCDANRVADDEKCVVCGAVHRTNREKGRAR